MPLSPAADRPPDPGRALIPREVLPPGVPRPARPHRRAPHADPARQLSLFGVESVDASPADLAGLLAGPGQLSRMGGTARVTVRVDAAWRVHALLPELLARGLKAGWLPADEDPADPNDPDKQADLRDPADRDPADPEPADPEPADPEPADPEPADPEPADGDPADDPDDPEVERAVRGGGGRFEVRTAYSSLLAGLARAWLADTAKRPPDRFFLTGPRLRLWVMAAGTSGPAGYTLGLGAADGADVWAAADAALTRAGLAGVVRDTDEGGPAYRITGRRRLSRLAELVGERPSAAPAGAWPGD